VLGCGIIIPTLESVDLVVVCTLTNLIVYVIGESEDDEPEDCDCLRQKPYVDINVIPVARLEQQRINTTSNDTIVNCGTRSATNSSQGAKVDEEASAADRSLRNLLLASSWE
jgi:hypothetical protein